MREGRQRKMDGRGVNGEEMTIQQEVEEEREGRRREKEEKRKKSRLRAEEESIWKEVGESLTSKSKAGVVRSKNSREVKRVIRSRDERRDPNTRTQNSKDKTKSENWENNSPRKPKEASRNVKYKIDPKEAEAGDGRSAVSRLFSTKRSRKETTKEEEEKEQGSRRGKMEDIGRGGGCGERGLEEREGGKVRESRRRREKSEWRGEIVEERGKKIKIVEEREKKIEIGEERGKKIEIVEERAKKIDGRRSLKKWLVGRLGRESLAESLSRGHVCRVRR